jgi:Holliday junction resolvase
MSEYTPPAPRFLTGDANETRRRNFKKHETGLAGLLGGRTTVGSGNKGQKGDVHGGNADAGQRIMAEAKSTDARQLTLKLDWLEKVTNEAREAGMEPALFLRFDASRFAGAKDWAVVPAERFRELLELEAQVRSPGRAE